MLGPDTNLRYKLNPESPKKNSRLRSPDFAGNTDAPFACLAPIRFGLFSQQLNRMPGTEFKMKMYLFSLRIFEIKR